MLEDLLAQPVDGRRRRRGVGRRDRGGERRPSGGRSFPTISGWRRGSRRLNRGDGGSVEARPRNSLPWAFPPFSTFARKLTRPTGRAGRSSQQLACQRQLGCQSVARRRPAAAGDAGPGALGRDRPAASASVRPARRSRARSSRGPRATCSRTSVSSNSIRRFCCMARLLVRAMTASARATSPRQRGWWSLSSW